MSIIFNEKTKEFHLFNNEISYIFNIMPNSQLGHLYFGKKLNIEILLNIFFKLKLEH